MANTNFARLTSQQLQVWSRDIWSAARDWSFLNNFVGTDSSAMIQRISEMKKTKNGARCVLTLVPDIEGDGVVGDSQLEGNEAELKAADQVIELDQLRNANRHEGRMADQRSVVVFREQSKDKLSYWLGDRIDQMAFLTLSGVSYAYTNNGALRVGSALPQLGFANDVTAPSANRHFRWSASSGISPSDTTQIVAADTPSWAMLVAAKATAVNNYIKPLRGDGGIAFYNVFMTPNGIAKLKQDPNFLEAWRYAEKRGKDNPTFKGTGQGGTNSGIMIDGMNVLEYRHVYNTTDAAAGSKWGAAGTVDGQRMLVCGAQAMGFGDIGMPEWDEKDFDYNNSPGISIAKIFGMKKPVFPSVKTGALEDFGVLCIDTAA